MDEPSPHELARLIALRQSSGSDARNLLAPPPPPIELEPSHKPPVRKKKAAKTIVNHQSKHKTLLKDMQHKIRTQSKEQQDKERDEKEQRLRLRFKSVGQVESKLFPLQNLSLNSSETTGSTTPFKGTCMTSTTDSTSSSTAASSSLVFKRLPLLDPKVIEKTKNHNDTMVRHDNYGRVPRYILERRIELLEEEQGKQMSADKNDLLATDPEHNNERCITRSHYKRATDMRLPDKQRILRELSENETKIKKELEKLPFGLQSEGSIRKRHLLYESMKDIEQKKKMVLSTPTWGRRRR